MGNHKNRPSGPNDKRQQFLARPSRRRISWNGILLIAGLGLLTALLYGARAPGAPVTGAGAVPPDELLPLGEDVQLSLSLFVDGRARFYRYTTPAGQAIRFFVLRSADGVVRAAFDACDVCYSKRRGYHQSGDNMVCNNCGQAFRSVAVNVVTGGCNPGTLERDVVGDRVVIKASAIERGTLYF